MVMRNFDWQEGDKSDGRRGKGFGRGLPARNDGILGRDRCGQLLLGSFLLVIIIANTAEELRLSYVPK